MSVYFIEAVGLDRVRIGHARDVPSRLEELRLVSPGMLRLLKSIDGGGRDARGLRRRFAEHREHAEWFKLEPLREFIETVPADYFQKEREAVIAGAVAVLERWLKEHGTTPYRFALDNGIDPSVIRKSMLHRRGFSPETALKIERGTGGEVPAKIFFKKEE